jgi:predicted acyltransferase
MEIKKIRKRIDSIDIVRGLAVLQMVFWQIFDFFARTDIYAKSDPLFLKAFNSPINGIGLVLFAFISGTSLFFAIEKRKNLKKSRIILHSLKRYGMYILLSLFFTSFVFGFDVFYRWGEAIQGIGFAAIIATFFLLLFRSKWLYLILGITLSFIQPVIRTIVNSIFSSYPLIPHEIDPLNNAISLLLNMTIRGYFSLTHVLPIIFFGIFLAILIKELKTEKKIIKISLAYSILFCSLGMVLHFWQKSIDVYEWTTAYQFFYTGFSCFLFMSSKSILLRYGRIKITNFLSVFGKTPLIGYLGHFLLIKKPLDLLGISNTFNYWISLSFAIILVSIIYWISKRWIGRKAPV